MFHALSHLHTRCSSEQMDHGYEPVAQSTNVTSDPVTSVTNARAPSPRPATAEELVGVTAMFRKLHIRPASLEPKKGNWAYRKTSPSPDDIPTADESHLWDDFCNPQEPADEDGDELPLEDEEQV